MNLDTEDGWLDVVVHSSAALLEDAAADLGALHEEAVAQSEQLDSLDSRVDRLLDRTGATPAPASSVAPRPDAPMAARSFSSEAIRARAEQNLGSRGIDAAEVSLDDLLDPHEIASIRARYLDGVDLRARLDRTDVAMAIVAGLAGGIVDALLVRTPAESPLTDALRGLALPADNWLAGVAEVPYDLSWNYELWLTPRYHRVQTLGHDPLLGLIWGTADILRQTCTGVRPDGTLGIVARAGDYPTTWPAALARQLLHTLSDLPTAAGIPLPGWTALAALQPGEDQHRNLAQVMYAQGYDSWHFLTMATAPATVELLCRGYWALRQDRDPEFAGHRAGPVADQPRYQALTLIAHGISAAVDLGTFVATGSNPLTLNYAQWVSLARKLATFAARPRHGDAAALALRNQRSIETGWPMWSPPSSP